MTRVISWGTATRATLNEELSQALVVLPIGAVEQHGPSLPTLTDIMIATHVAEAAAGLAVTRGSISIVLAPPLPFGVSAHHLPFGGTLAISTSTMLAVLEDLIDSIESQGGRRLLIVNGHGGNRGVARAAASGADARESVTVASVDYWECAPGSIPGHAGEVEASLVMALAPELIASPLPSRENPPSISSIGPASYHGSWLWESIDGYTDNPAKASVEHGQSHLEAIIDGLAEVMLLFGRLPS